MKTLVLLENVQQSVKQRSHQSITSCSLTSKIYSFRGAKESLVNEAISLFCCLIFDNLLTDVVKLGRRPKFCTLSMIVADVT